MELPQKPEPDDRIMPVVPLWLGLAGAIPFVALSGLIVLLHFDINSGLPERLLHQALLTYAALIASFLGGVRWGLAFAAPESRQTSLFVASVCPSLVAWMALAVPRPYDLVIVITLFLCLLVMDVQLVRQRIVPRWFGSLRVLLSCFIILSLLGPLAFELGL